MKRFAYSLFAACLSLSMGSMGLSALTGTAYAAQPSLMTAPSAAPDARASTPNVQAVQYRDYRDRRHWRHDRPRYRPHYRHHRRYWAPPAYRPHRYRAAPAWRGGNPHVRWCYNRYRSYRTYNNTFQPNYGPRRQCYSPYL